ncbi:MAG: hypothetical protein K0R84_331 [Clostridia bacterium]|jgi:hypothetical protein|nr:hypothetical protein [Clostridia bacterium]
MERYFSDGIFMPIVLALIFLWGAFNNIYGALKRPHKFLRQWHTNLTTDILGEENAKVWFIFWGIVSGIIGIALLLLLLYVYIKVNYLVE